MPLTPSAAGVPKPGFLQDREKPGDVQSGWVLASILVIMILVENGTAVSGWHEEAPTSSVKITGICVSWANATCTPERDKKDRTERLQL